MPVTQHHGGTSLTPLLSKWQKNILKESLRSADDCYITFSLSHDTVSCVFAWYHVVFFAAFQSMRFLRRILVKTQDVNCLWNFGNQQLAELLKADKIYIQGQAWRESLQNILILSYCRHCKLNIIHEKSWCLLNTYKVRTKFTKWFHPMYTGTQTNREKEKSFRQTAIQRQINRNKRHMEGH